MHGRLAAALAVALLAGLCTVVHIGSAGMRVAQAELVPTPTRAPERAILLFVDSLSDDVARNPDIMPALAALNHDGASFEVEPCRDRLTYLCLHAMFTGRDESSLVTFHRNFDETRESRGGTFLHELAASGKKVAALGTHDLAPYRSAFVAARHFARTDESVGHVVRAWAELDAAWTPDVMLIGLGSGDLAAHAHGTRSKEYREAFRNIDDIIGELARRRPRGAHLVVFGDHGHDSEGRHLPGGPATTWAVYTGPAFRQGVAGSMEITDHRALLGVLLGATAPRSYRGPELAEVLDPSWVERQLGGTLPHLAPATSQPPAPAVGTAVGVAIGALGALGIWLGLRCWWHSSARALAAAFALCALAAAGGAFHDEVRLTIHDHGFAPERSLYLAIPFVGGFGLAALMRRYGVLRRARPGAWLPTGAAASLSVVLLLLFPSAYFYGSARAVVYAALLMVVILVVDTWKEVPPGWRARYETVAPALVAVLALATFSGVARQEVGELDSIYVLTAPVYRGSAWLAFLSAKAAVFVLLGCAHAPARPLDTAGAASLLTASTLVQISGATMDTWVYGALALGLVIAYRWSRRHAPLTQLAGGLLLLNHLYGPNPAHVAPIEVLLAGSLAALYAFRRMGMQRDSWAAACGFTLATTAYLLLWPTVGFRLAGIDFRFMFQWVSPERYEELWWVIAAGVVVKLAAPYLLLYQVADQCGTPRASGRIAGTLLSAKVLLLSVMLVAYGAGHSMTSRLATDMLAELALVIAVLVWMVPIALRSSPPFSGSDPAESALRSAPPC